MEVPREFVHLAHCFHQDIMLVASSEQEMVTHALRCLRPPEQAVVKRFLTELLASNPSGRELQAVWNGTGPDWDFADEGLRKLFAMIRDAIE